MNKCNHENYEKISEHAFTGSVAVHPYTSENQAARGWITAVQECAYCGAHRLVNENGSHEELGVWGPSAKEREAAEIKRQAELDAKNKQIEAEEHKKIDKKVLQITQLKRVIQRSNGINGLFGYTDGSEREYLLDDLKYDAIYGPDNVHRDICGSMARSVENRLEEIKAGKYAMCWN